MKKNHPKADTTIADEGTLASENIFKELAEATAAETQKRASPNNEPFDSYVHKIQSKWHTDRTLFGSRLAKGYDSLLDEIKAEQMSSIRRSPKL